MSSATDTSAATAGDSAPDDPHADDTFTRRYIPALGRSVHRVGLAGNYGISTDGLREALTMGPELIMWTPRVKAFTPALREAFKRDRERYVLLSGPSMCYTARGLRKGVDAIRRALDTDTIDILQIFWLGKTSAWTPGVVDALVKLREDGVARAIGVSIHDRKRAGELARESPLDVLMLRYNAAHPGAEADVFPHLHHRKPAVVGYTATAWGKLLKAPKGWSGPTPTAGDCYRFALSNPHVDVVLTGPGSLEQLRENLHAVERGPLTEEEDLRMRELGRQVKNTKGLISVFNAV